MLWLQIGSAVTGFVAAVLWFRSTITKAPPLIADGGVSLQRFIDGAARLNKWAAGATAASMLLSATASAVAIWLHMS